MTQWNEWLLMALAYAVALLLFGLGVRKVPMRKNGRRGIFMAALSFFLAGEAGTAEINRSGSAGTPPLARATATDLPLPQEFAAPGKWEAFRVFWQKLSDIDTSSYHAEYSGSDRDAKDLSADRRFESATVRGVLTAEKSRELERELADLFSGRQPPSRSFFPVLSAETAPFASRMGQLLHFILSQRLSALGFDRSMTTRMMVPITSRYPRSIHQRIEVRIDLLLEKQAAGEISESEYAAIIASIENDMYLSAFMAALSGVFPQGALHPLPKGAGEDRSPDIGGHLGDLVAPNDAPLFNNPENWLRGWEHAIDLRRKQLEQLPSAEQTQPERETPHKRATRPERSDSAKVLADLEKSAARTRELLTELEGLRKPLRVLLADLERRP